MEETLINGKTLSFYLRHPGALKAVDRSDLIGLATQFPYSAHLHLLLTIKDHLENKSADRELLERAAIYISDRRKLGEWMNKLQSLRQEEGLVYGNEHLEVLSQSLEDLTAGTEKDHMIEEDPRQLEDLDFETAPEAEKYDESDFPEEDIWVEKIEVGLEDGVVEKILVQVDEEFAPEEPSGSIIEKEVEESPENLISENIQIQLPELEEEQEEEVEETSPLETAEIIHLSDSESISLPEPDNQLQTPDLDEPHQPPSPIREENELEIIPETKIEETAEPDTPFLRWLQRLETGKMGGYIDLEADRSKKSADKEDKETQKVSSKKKKKKKKKKKSWKQDSLRVDETLVSEALADLLATQGHVERAIEMYDKLRLTIPEKSVFFAQKIKALMPKN